MITKKEVNNLIENRNDEKWIFLKLSGYKIKIKKNICEMIFNKFEEEIEIEGKIKINNVLHWKRTKCDYALETGRLYIIRSKGSSGIIRSNNSYDIKEYVESYPEYKDYKLYHYIIPEDKGNGYLFQIISLGEAVITGTIISEKGEKINIERRDLDENEFSKIL